MDELSRNPVAEPQEIWRDTHHDNQYNRKGLGTGSLTKEPTRSQQEISLMI